MSRIAVIFTPAVEIPRIAASRALPTPLTIMLASSNPNCFACSIKLVTACVAAYGVDFRVPENPTRPELEDAITFPCKSVIVIRVLLNVALICTTPVFTLRFAFFLVLFCLVDLVVAIGKYYVFSLLDFRPLPAVLRTFPRTVREFVFVR
jgi:hypothetical protein